MMKILASRILFLITLLFIIQPISTVKAHGYIVRAIPEDRVVLERAPTRLQYWFSEALEPDFSTINVRNTEGEIIATGGLDPDNNTLMNAQLPRDLVDGAYIVELRPAFASDGHVVAESRVFFVGQEVGGVSGSAASDQAVPLEVLWRGVLLASVLLLFGTITLYTGILVPVWGNPAYPAGLLPPRVMNRIFLISAISLAFAIAANIFALLQQATTFFNTDFGTVISGGLWAVVRIGSRFGDVWNFRMGFLVLVGILLAAAWYYRTSQPKTVRPFFSAGVWVMALVVGTFSVVSHAAGSQILPWVGVTFDWLHILAVGFWVGGLMAMVLIFPVALKPYTDEQRRQAILVVLRRFSPLAAASLGIVIATGFYASSTWINTPSELTGTSFGGSLMIKMFLVVLLVALGAVHHISLRPERYQRFEAIIKRAGNYVTTLRLEVVFAVLVLFSAGLLTATPVPIPEFIENQIPPPRATIEVNDYTVNLTITPGGTGINTYDTTLLRNGQPVDDAQVNLQMVKPDQDRRGEWNQVEQVDSGLYVTAGDEIDETGAWWTLVNVVDSNGELHRAAFTWDISDAANVIDSRPPSVLTLLMIAGVFAAIVYAIYPMTRRFYSHLDTSPLYVSIAVWATVATVLFAIAGYIILDQTSRNYASTLNPTPDVVNTVLPDQTSLERGEALYNAHCNAWEDEETDFRGLLNRLYRTRDEELYRFVAEGWRSLSACGTDLTPSERWDVVNYIRTFTPDTSANSSTTDDVSADVSASS